jgi:hypothetical protein
MHKSEVIKNFMKLKSERLKVFQTYSKYHLMNSIVAAIQESVIGKIRGIDIEE